MPDRPLIEAVIAQARAQIAAHGSDAGRSIYYGFTDATIRLVLAEVQVSDTDLARSIRAPLERCVRLADEIDRAIVERYEARLVPCIDCGHARGDHPGPCLDCGCPRFVQEARRA